jgi:hypothetical protein
MRTSLVLSPRLHTSKKGNMHPQPLGQEAAADRAGRLRADAARLAWASVLGMSLFAAATVALHLLDPDLDPISRTVSEYVLAPREDRLRTAVFASNDRCAMGRVDTLTRAGVRVPEEVSVVGFDDSQIARLSQIGLTTIRQDIQGIAQGAVRTAIQRLDDAQAPPRELVLDPKLIVRETTRPPC